MAIEEYDVILVTQEEKHFKDYRIKAVQRFFGCKKDHKTSLIGMVHVVDKNNNHFAFCETCGVLILNNKSSHFFVHGWHELLETNPIQLNYEVIARFAEVRKKIENTEPRTFKQWYNVYLQSDVWKRKRQRVLERANYLCESCMEEPATLVHHLTYDRVGKEPLFDLVALCDNCHKQIHNIQKG